MGSEPKYRYWSFTARIKTFIRGRFPGIFEVERLGRLGSTGTRGCPTDTLSVYFLLDARGVNKRLGVEVAKFGVTCGVYFS
eukprot:SAG11_NODE_6726_length_1258_cov_4.865401_1_plen_81_part_00